jgi:hypothetical protein
MEATEQAGYTPETPVEFSEEQLARVRTNTDEYLTDSAKKLEKMKWYEHNLVTLRARKALREAGYEG